MLNEKIIQELRSRHEAGKEIGSDRLLLDAAELIESLQSDNIEQYREGYRDGLSAYAWWKDGVQYVGTCGTRLKEALKEIHDA